MNPGKQSKKALRSLISDSFKEALTGLDLPEPTKKVKKLIDKNAKELASLYSDLVKKEEKKRRKAEKLMEKAIAQQNGKKKRRLRTEEKMIEQG